jgi:hypothetical protein
LTNACNDQEEKSGVNVETALDAVEKKKEKVRFFARYARKKGKNEPKFAYIKFFLYLCSRKLQSLNKISSDTWC